MTTGNCVFAFFPTACLLSSSHIEKLLITFFSFSLCPHYRFQCIQACDYDETKLVTGENLIRHRATKFAHLSLKHISLIGVVRLKVKNKKKRKKVEKSRRPEIGEGGGGDSARQFLFDQAG